MEPECSLLCSQQSYIGPYSEPYASNSHLPTLFPYDTALHYSPIYVYVFQMVSSLQVL
jgi:hypothetical protein